MNLKAQLDSIYLEEELYWKTRAKQQWLEEGDSNIQYFHTVANNRKKKNNIFSFP